VFRRLPRLSLLLGAKHVVHQNEKHQYSTKKKVG
jgi:hypothetical protein